MRIALVAYACEPNRGSEPGVGWSWSLALAEQGHEVTVYTHASQRAAIEAVTPRPGLSFSFVGNPRLPREHYNRISLQIYYYYWQLRVAMMARKRADFDVLHYITYGGVRMPTFGWLQGAPVVIGPLGGWEEPPLRLVRGLGVRAYLIEMIRNLSNTIARVDPICLLAFQCATTVLFKTDHSRSKAFLPVEKTACCLEIGASNIAYEISPRTGAIKALFVGRLLYWKGADICIKSVATAHRAGSSVELTIVGSGPDEARLKRLAVKLGIEPIVRFISWVPHDKMSQLYDEHDLLLFPSLHDSSGNVVVEALSRGRPVICLDIGGPAAILRAAGGGGIIVNVSDCSLKTAVSRVARELSDLAASTDRVFELQKEALKGAKRINLGENIRQTYVRICRDISRPKHI